VRYTPSGYGWGETGLETENRHSSESASNNAPSPSRLPDFEFEFELHGNSWQFMANYVCCRVYVAVRRAKQRQS
jgi:hypothetical protein